MQINTISVGLSIIYSNWSHAGIIIKIIIFVTVFLILNKQCRPCIMKGTWESKICAQISLFLYF